MSRYIAYFLLGCLVIPFGIKVITYVDYAVRYDYYVDVLCENKANKARQCNGTCQLSDLTVTNNNTEKPIVPNLSKSEISFFTIQNHLIVTLDLENILLN